MPARVLPRLCRADVMLFNSFAFLLVFLPLTLIGVFGVPFRGRRWPLAWLLIASLVFYSVWNPRFVALLVGSILFNFLAGRAIGEARLHGGPSALLLRCAVVADLAVLAWFKYANFFIEAFDAAFDRQGPTLDIVLPIGISFFTFTQIAYLVDAARGQANHRAGLLEYGLFVTWFPHLIAGPVLHHAQMVPQFASRATWRFNRTHIAVGLTVFILGLAKKVLLADELAPHVGPVFSAAAQGIAPGWLEGWTATLAYTLQLYFDFSGYSDMALGLSLMFNVRLPLNFDSPYRSGSVIDFWRRWHMTLSAFLRDYLYFALGGNRHGAVRRYTNLMITMVLGGLWHGAGWTFIVWGALHGAYLMVNHAWRAWRPRLIASAPGRVERVASGVLTFLCVSIAWVFFRADTLEAARLMLGAILGGGEWGFRWTPIREALKAIVPGLIIVLLMPNVKDLMSGYRISSDTSPARHNGLDRPQSRGLRWRPSRVHALGLAVLALWCADRMSRVSEFLYFRF